MQLETLATNEQALAAYRRAGFVQEGALREDAWVEGGRVDEVVMSVLAREWRALTRVGSRAPSGPMMDGPPIADPGPS